MCIRDRYRTVLSASSDTAVGDDCKEVISATITSTDLSNGYIDYTDESPDEFLGANLYTNSNQEGISQANSIPPWARFVAEYKGHTFYGDWRQPQQIELQLK